MSISLKSLLELVFVVLILKLIVSRWKPPIQESIQAILCIILGTTMGYLINPTKEGIVTGIISSGIAFYGGELFAEFKSVKNDLSEEVKKKDNKDEK